MVCVGGMLCRWLLGQVHNKGTTNTERCLALDAPQSCNPHKLTTIFLSAEKDTFF